MKFFKKIMIFFILISTLFVCFIFGKLRKTKEYADNFDIEQLSLKDKDDGWYEGSTLWEMVVVRLRVEVENHHIKDIVIMEHQNGMGENAELMIPDMIERNTQDVDVISQATISSKAIQNAVQTALH